MFATLRWRPLRILSLQQSHHREGELGTDDDRSIETLAVENLCLSPLPRLHRDHSGVDTTRVFRAPTVRLMQPESQD